MSSILHEYDDREEHKVMSSVPNSDQGSKSRDVKTSIDESKKTILIYSPDLNFCFSLSMFFQDRYNVISTTNLGMLDKFVSDYSADLVMVDAVPSEKMIERLNGLRGLNDRLAIIMLYVYSGKNVHFDQRIRGQVDSVFYKPFDLSTVSKRIEELLP